MINLKKPLERALIMIRAMSKVGIIADVKKMHRLVSVVNFGIHSVSDMPIA
jgi:hypothetical protein